MTIRRLFAIAALTVPALVAACAEHNPSGPLPVVGASAAFERGDVKDMLPGQANGATNNSGRAGFVHCENSPAATGSADIGPSGGQLVVGRARLIVPPGALNTIVRITGTTLEGEVATVSFKPEGLTFRKPAGLQFDVAGCDVSGGAPDVVFVSDTGEILEHIDAVFSTFWHTVAAPIDHFSNYALAW